jgi:glucose-6-phosphate isomerase
LHLSIHHDKPESESCFERFRTSSVLGGLKALDSRARRKGLKALDPSRGALIPIGMEIDRGRVTKNGYGVFNLAWQAENHPEWPQMIEQEIAEIRAGIKDAHDAPLQYLIWTGMGGSSEDKAMYQAVGLLRHGPKVYVLDSTDPEKLNAIIADMKQRSGLDERQLWKRTLVVAMAMGMTSYEPVVNLRKIAERYDALRVDSRPNIYYLTLPGSLLDKFASAREYRRVPLQLDEGNSTAGRHSAPMTRGSLYPLALAGVDLKEWVAGAMLSSDEIHTAWRLAAFLHTQGLEGRDKITLLLPRGWTGAGIWTKQDFEESLGKSAEYGLKIVIGEKIRMTNYRAPRDPRQDRIFFAVQIKGETDQQAGKIALLRRAGYPVASITLPGSMLSKYMQFVHYVVFGLAWLRKINFVTQPNVELYKAITNRLHAESERAGGIAKTREWRRGAESERAAAWRGRVTLRWDRLANAGEAGAVTAPAFYASLLKNHLTGGNAKYGELTFFGDTRYAARGRAVRAILDRAAERLFRAGLKVPVDVYEGPAMNHSYHEMIIGHGKCFSTILIAEPEAAADYHRAQFLATQMALAERGRAVVSITLKNLEEPTLRALDEFFRQAATQIRARRS